ncbi:hypothetical protein OUZ56_001751 [Daphnia magna]|uniref:Uncharacterized protein n=1 Tax=Daphnia magna TaxID=35525 RepID=A0ABR0A3L7_9CRUS|nr:hypothetical protein OUZ56_001751 [Daphnia magna]
MNEAPDLLEKEKNLFLFLLPFLNAAASSEGLKRKIGYFCWMCCSSSVPTLYLPPLEGSGGAG